MTASHDRRRSNTSPSISQAPEPPAAPMPLKSGDPVTEPDRPPTGKGFYQEILRVDDRISQAPVMG